MLNDLKTPFFTVLFIFVGLVLYATFFGAIPFSVNSVTTAKSQPFQATGTGKATAVPNTALVSLGVTTTTNTVLDAQNQTNAAVNKLIDDLKKLGVEEKNIKTTNYSVFPVTDFSGRTQRTTGYTVTQNLEVKVTPIDQANRVVDTATADGANIVGGITFVLDDQTQKKLEDNARKEAVKNAKEKAESLANAAGIRLGRIIDVQESFVGKPIPLRALSVEDSTQPSTPTTLTPGENTVEITVTLSFET